MTSSGEKLGKSAGNAVWLSGSSYHLYQSMLQVADQEVEAMLGHLTFLPLEEVSGVMEQHTVRPSCIHGDVETLPLPSLMDCRHILRDTWPRGHLLSR